MLEINKERLLKNIKAQGQIGWIENEGLNRLCYSDSFFEVRDFVKSIYDAYDIPVEIDSLGNIFGTVEGKNKESIILSGSHLDSVKNGGPFDGAYGAMVSQEVALTLKENGISLNHTYQAVGFNAEEGSPLGGSFGSRGICGMIDPYPTNELLHQYGITKEDIHNAERIDDRYKAYLEIHIEQGPVLDNEKLDIGVPTAIVGITRYRCRVVGAGNHAGTTPMLARQDALFETMRAITPWIEQIRQEPVMVCNIGDLKVYPGHVAVIPEMVEFTVEIRALDDTDVNRAVASLKAAMSTIKNCEVTVDFDVQKAPVELNQDLVNLVYHTSVDKGYITKKMPSGASHDASPISTKIPAAMIFVPSVKGISHHHDEYTKDEDLVNGAQLLLDVIMKIDQS